MAIDKQFIEQITSEVSAGLSEERGLSYGYDQSKGNLCHLLTHAVMNRIARQTGHEDSLRRELHRDEEGNWQYLIAHGSASAEPTDKDLISDLNPWQWGGEGSGILHMPRRELMELLEHKGAPLGFVALRSVDTIVSKHDTRLNPFSN